MLSLFFLLPYPKAYISKASVQRCCNEKDLSIVYQPWRFDSCVANQDTKVVPVRSRFSLVFAFFTVNVFLLAIACICITNQRFSIHANARQSS